MYLTPFYQVEHKTKYNVDVDFSNNSIYLPLNDGDVDSAFYNSIINAVPKRMALDVANDKLKQLELSTNWFIKGFVYWLNLLHINTNAFVSSGTVSKYSDPSLYPLLNETDFRIDDPSFMKQFEKQPSYYLTLDSKPQCNVDIANIIPYDYLKLSADVPLPSSDEENVKRIALVDAELIEYEKWGQNLKSYEIMRESAMKEMDGIYANDHIELRHAKAMYRSIRDLEIKVVQVLYDRMNATHCYDSVINRYNEMTRELSLEKREEMKLFRESLEKEYKEKGSSEIVTTEMANELFTKQQEKLKKKRMYRYYHTDYFTSSNDVYCDGCEIIRPKEKKFKKTVRPATKFDNGLSIRKWIGDEEVSTIYTVDHPWYPNATTPVDITGIASASWDRMFELKQMLTRWRGPLSIVFICQSQFEKRAINYIARHHFPKRLTLILYTMKEYHYYYDHFPINYLRNIAIANIQTTHFLVLDMDLRVSKNTYSELMRIPEYIRNSNRSAVILPIFFFNHTSLLRRCTSIENCAFLSNWYQPESKLELINCIHTLNCYSNKQLIRTHMYVMPEWYIAKESSSVSRIRCFITDFMEPYFLIRYTPETPLFDDRFINYGYNKVQYFENIRQMGYQFYILNHAFAMDFPHPETSFRKSYSDIIHSNNDNPMKLLYNELQKNYSAKYNSIQNSRVCYLRQKSYYEMM